MEYSSLSFDMSLDQAGCNFQFRKAQQLFLARNVFISKDEA